VTLTLTSDNLESCCECLIDLNKYQYLVCGCIVFHCGCTDGCTYVCNMSIPRVLMLYYIDSERCANNTSYINKQGESLVYWSTLMTRKMSGDG